MNAATPKNTEANIQTISENRRARREFAVQETFECGIELLGTEVKSLRSRHVNFSDSYAFVKDNEVFLIGLKIEPYKFGTHANHSSDRTRKLLLHRRQITKIQKEMQRKAMTLIPLKLYFKNGKVKVLIGLCLGKTKIDKRDDIKKREADREVARVLKRGNR